MKYQLVLQFPASSIADYDELIAIEDLLIEIEAMAVVPE